MKKCLSLTVILWHIYAQFPEHLGAGAYGGIWMGDEYSEHRSIRDRFPECSPGFANIKYPLARRLF